MRAFLGLGFLLLGSAALAADSPRAAARPEPAATPVAFGLSIAIEDTRLSATSRALEPFVLVLASPGRGPVVTRTIAPGAELVALHPPKALAGLTLEVLAARAGRVASSGRLVLDGDALCLAVEHDGSALGVRAGRPVHVLAGSAPFEGERAHPLHVPIPSPAERPRGERPPPVEKEPPPPV